MTILKYWLAVKSSQTLWHLKYKNQNLMHATLMMVILPHQPLESSSSWSPHFLCEQSNTISSQPRALHTIFTLIPSGPGLYIILTLNHMYCLKLFNWCGLTTWNHRYLHSWHGSEVTPNQGEHAAVAIGNLKECKKIINAHTSYCVLFSACS